MSDEGNDDAVGEPPLLNDAEDAVEARGELVASIPRSGRREQLRIILDQWNGRSFASARIWFKDANGSFRPTRKGLTFRRTELLTVLQALIEIARRLGVLATTESTAVGSETASTK